MDVLIKQFDYIFRRKEPVALGLIVLQTDEVIEQEFATYFSGANINILHSRIPVDQNISAETLMAMKAHMQASADLLPSDLTLDCIAYGCTSAAMVIGEDVVNDLLTDRQRAYKASNPLTAVKKALSVSNVKTLACLAPYEPKVTQGIGEALSQEGHKLIGIGSFYEPYDISVSRISTESIYQAACRLIQECETLPDALFLSCTNLPCINIIKKLEDELGILVLSSNMAMAWHIARLTQLDHKPVEFGKLWAY